MEKGEEKRKNKNKIKRKKTNLTSENDSMPLGKKLDMVSLTMLNKAMVEKTTSGVSAFPNKT